MNARYGTFGFKSLQSQPALIPARWARGDATFARFWMCLKTRHGWIAGEVGVAACFLGTGSWGFLLV